MDDSILFAIFLIFTGAGFLATLALFTKQSLLVAYILLGVIVGPWGLGWLNDISVIDQTGDIGIIFLLFLLGLHLQPQNLIHMLSKTTAVAVLSSIAFCGIGYGTTLAFGYSHADALLVGAALMFSSTIICLKLLPTTILHHQHIGELIISVLLMQDIIAIIVLLMVHGATAGGLTPKEIGVVVLAFPGLAFVAFLMERLVLLRLFARFDQIHEYIFLVSIGWCVGLAQLGSYFGLSHEVGAFIAGVALASSPIAAYIAESLRPLRDFFLVLFFFSVGASFDFNRLHQPDILYPSITLAILILTLKPIIFRYLLGLNGETKAVAWEVGTRLSQCSEFSILLAYIAVEATSSELFSPQIGYVIKAATVITFIVSSYYVVFRYPTPIAVVDKLRRD